MPSQQCETAVRRMFEALNQPHVPADLDQFVDPNWVNHDPSLPPFQGLEGAKQLHDFFWKPFSDLKMTVEIMFSEGDYVAAHFTMQGKHTGEFHGIQATGKTISITGTGMFRCHNGKIAENWVNIDALGMMQQLGVVQMPGQAQRRAA